jgi:nucleoside-diphosphate-sugar epimerase
MPDMGRVLVTGATGGLGRVLVPALVARGAEVWATGRNRDIGAALAGCRFLPADLAEDDLAPLLRGVDAVFHLAALSSPWGRQADFVRANVTASTRLLAAAEAAGVKSFIFASTPSIYTDNRDQIGITEATPLPRRFANAYAATKYTAERHILAHNGAMATVALRPRAIISPYDTALLPRLERAAARGTLPLPNGGDALVELCDARDVASAFLAAHDHIPAVNRQVFNISGGTPRPLRAIVGHLFALLHRDVRIRPLPAGLLTNLGGIMETLARALPRQPEPPLTRYSAMVLGYSQTFDLTAARTRLHWAPQYTPEQALDWAIGARGHG